MDNYYFTNVYNLLIQNLQIGESVSFFNLDGAPEIPGRRLTSEQTLNESPVINQQVAVVDPTYNQQMAISPSMQELNGRRSVESTSMTTVADSTQTVSTGGSMGGGY